MARSTRDAAITPLDAQQVADRFARVTAMIEAGNPRPARQATVELAAAADDATAALLWSCLQALERARPVAVPLLRRLWIDADPDGRALIEACVPREPALPALPGPTRPQRPAGTTGPVHQHSTRPGPARGRRSRAGADRSRDAARYFTQDAEPGGIDALADDLDARGGDYPGWVEDELAAMLPARGTLCVSCFIERPVAEQRRRDDDGLCGDCRDAGEVGIAERGTDRAGQVRARVAHIAARAANPEHALSLLRGEYDRAHPGDRPLIVAWVHQHLPA